MNTLRDFTISVLNYYFGLRNEAGRKKTNNDWEIACNHVYELAQKDYPDFKEFKSAIGKDRKAYKKERELAKSSTPREKVAVIKSTISRVVQGELFPSSWSERISMT